jgi:hypothetical protein
MTLLGDILIRPSSPGGEEFCMRRSLIRLGVLLASLASLAAIVGGFKGW